MTKTKKVLVTGGAGFIGSHLCEFLVRKGFKVYCLDNLFAGSLDNLSSLKRSKKFEFIKGDIRNKNQVEKAVRKVDSVFHLAAIAGVEYVVKNPLEDINVNYLGTKNVIESAYKNGKKKIVFASTSEVYGKNPKVPLKENSDSVFGATNINRWGYGMTKAIGEHLLYAYSLKGLTFSIVRFFNIYGPRSINKRYSHVVPKFIINARKDKPLTVYGDGKQIRCFTYIDDAVEGIYKAFTKLENDVVNVGTGQKTEILSLAKKIIRLTSSTSKIEYIKFDEVYREKFEDTMMRVPDNRKARSIGIKFETNLNDGLRNTISWIMNKYP